MGNQTFTLVPSWTKIHFNIRPLETLFNNPKSKTQARIERWKLRLQSYNFQMKYKPSKSNAADYLSRHPFSSTLKSNIQS